MIIATKAFHHQNLILQAIHDPVLDIYYINIRRQNDDTDHDLFGMFVTQADLMAKFHAIRL